MESRNRTSAEEILSKVFAYNPMGVTISRLDTGRLIDVNPRFEIITGFSREEIIGKSTLEIGVWTDSKNRSDTISELKKKRSIRDLSVSFRSKSGEVLLWRVAMEMIDVEGVECIISIIDDITERKQAEAALQASEERLRQIIDLVPHFIFAKDINGKFILVNKATADAYGTTVDKLTGMTDADFAKSEEEVRFFREKDLDVINSGSPIIIPEEKITDSQGKVRYLTTTKIPFTFSEKNLAAVLGVAVDITDQRWVAEQNRKLSRAVEQSPVSIVITNLTGAIEYVNPKFTEVTGYTLKEVIGRNPRILRSGKMDESVYEELWKTITSGRKWQGELHNRKKNGDIYWEYVSISPIRNDEERITHFIGVKEDITERKKREELLKFEERFRQLLMEISSSYINLPLHEVERSIDNTLAVMGRFVGADRAYVFDLDQSTMLSSNTFEWCNEGVTPEIDNLQEIELPDEWDEAFRKGEAVIIPDVPALPRGYVRDVLEQQDIKSLIVIPMMSNGICIGFIGFDSVYDYHFYSNVEQQLLQVFCQMMVNIRLRKKTDEELIRAKERAEESNLLKTHFLANMSHEIRTPMNGILGFLQLLKEMDMSEEKRDRYIDLVNQSGQRLLETIKDIIEMSRIETGHLHADIKETNLSVVMHFIYDFFKQQADRKGVELIKNESPECDHLTIMTDRIKLEAILSNLIKNAIKFTNKGLIEFGNYLEKTFIVFYVRDTGTGIPPDRLNAIFEMFVQADLSSSRPYEGSGLGLSIARAYLEKLGGRIWVESEVGAGSTFYFSLPVTTID